MNSFGGLHLISVMVLWINQGDAILDLASLFNGSIPDSIKFTDISPNDVDFFLYKPSNETIQYKLSNSSNILDLSYPTKIITHGWKSNATKSWVQDMAYRYHQKSKCNVVGVNWEKYSEGLYLTAARATRSVGFIIADFILQQKPTFLQTLHLKPSFLKTLHLIGHSLGAHISGFAGKKIKNETGKSIDRITALDAAAPLFETPEKRDPEDRLDKKDASYVDLIHTAMLTLLGVTNSYGDIDFYVNHGTNQLNCTEELPNIITTASCEHSSSQWYFSKTITHPKMYAAVKCVNGTEFEKGDCDNNEKAFMGEGVDREAKGTFYIDIDEEGDHVSPNTY